MVLNLTPAGVGVGAFNSHQGSNHLFRGSMCPARLGHTQECSSSPSLPSTLESQLESPYSATYKQQTSVYHVSCHSTLLSIHLKPTTLGRQMPVATQVTPGNVWFIVFQSLMGLGRTHQAGLLSHISHKGRPWSFPHSRLTVPWKT